MEDDGNLRILVDMIFSKEIPSAEKIIERYPSIPTCMLTENFSERIQAVLFVRIQITACRWRNFFDTCYKKMLSSHQMFLRFIMFACIGEDQCHQNVFESFLSVCSLVKLLCDETFQKTGVDFCHFSSDIIMVFYRCKLKDTFCRRGGLERFVEYIRNHKYLTWKLNENSVSLENFAVFSKAVESDLDEKIKKELKRDGVAEKEIDPDKAEKNITSKVLAKGVLSITLAQLPILPSYPDLINSIVAYRRKKMEKAEKNKTEAINKSKDSNTAQHGCSNSESKTDHDAKHQKSIEMYDDIIQAVIRHNLSKSSKNQNANNRIREEADRVLEHLKDTLKSLIEVLDEFDNE